MRDTTIPGWTQHDLQEAIQALDTFANKLAMDSPSLEPLWTLQLSPGPDGICLASWEFTWPELRIALEHVYGLPIAIIPPTEGDEA